MKVFVLALALAAVVSAVPTKKNQRWEPVTEPRDLSKYIRKDLLYKPKTAAPHGRIVGGSEVTPHSVPHQVGLFIDDMYFCGGSIIDGKWILTAAHCTDGATFVEVVAGAHNIRENESTQQRITSDKLTVHENWNSFDLSNDISVIALPEAISFDSNIDTVSLASSSSSDPSPGDMVTITGWGRPSDSASSISEVLRTVTVPVMSNRECNNVYGIIGDGQICIDSTGGMGSCNGDSGGPMTYGGKQVGIVSFGSSTGCETGYPDGFTRVSYYAKWINGQTGVKF